MPSFTPGQWALLAIAGSLVLPWAIACGVDLYRRLTRKPPLL